jgi:WXXGXW repeat (2 copies)
MNLNWIHGSKVSRWIVLSIVLLGFCGASFAQIAVGISVRIGPPALPVYNQPLCPGPGYMWTPGYWAWSDDDGYYWVPGTWVVAPVGMLWTPGYWGWAGGVYVWNAGYWGPHIGFYGGINYGFGYGGVGFAGGEWRGGAFFYNRSVTNVTVTNVTNVYTKTVIVNENHVAFNGGEGGIAARPTPEEAQYAHEQHMAPLAAQTQQQHMAMQNRDNFANVNHGRPAVAATARPGDFSAHSAIGARSAGGEYRAPAMSPREARASAPASRPNEAARSNEGFRPFTPPAKNNGGNTRPENQNRGNESRPQSHQNASEPHKSSPPPAKHSSPPPKQEKHQ